MLMQFPKTFFFQKMNYPPPYDQGVSSQGGSPPSGYGPTYGCIFPPEDYGAFPPGSPHGGYPIPDGNQAGFPPSGYPGIQNHGDYPPGVHQKVPPHGPMGFPPAGNLQTITHSENSEARPLLTGAVWFTG